MEILKLHYFEVVSINFAKRFRKHDTPLLYLRRSIFPREMFEYFYFNLNLHRRFYSDTLKYLFPVRSPLVPYIFSRRRGYIRSRCVAIIPSRSYFTFASNCLAKIPIFLPLASTDGRASERRATPVPLFVSRRSFSTSL
jgi:hypothetical protein